MKVFLSWSGELSHKIAGSFRDWLPVTLQYVEPYVSSEDIDKGARWGTDIAKELEASHFGILLITKENLHAPWISFEAGALSKALEKSRVAPFLFDIKRSEVQGPLLQFQSTIFTKKDIYKLVESINNNALEDEKLPDARLNKIFERWWPELKGELDNFLKESPAIKMKKSPTEKTADKQDILEELIDLTRDQYKMLKTPESLIPLMYPDEIFDDFEHAKPHMINACKNSNNVKIMAFQGDSFLGDGEIIDPDHPADYSNIETLKVLVSSFFSDWVLNEDSRLRRRWMDRKKHPYETLKTLKSRHNIVRDAFAKIESRLKNKNESGLRHYLTNPHFRMLITETSAFVSSYSDLTKEQVIDLPIARYNRRDGSIYFAFKRLFNDIWNNHTELSDLPRDLRLKIINKLQKDEYKETKIENSGSGIIFRNKDSKIYVALTYHENNGTKEYVFPGGHLDPSRGDKDTKDAFIEETKEEISLDISKIQAKILHVNSYIDGTHYENNEIKVVDVYQVEYDSDELEVLMHDDYHTGSEWWCADSKRPPQMKYDNQYDIMKKFLRSL